MALADGPIESLADGGERIVGRHAFTAAVPHGVADRENMATPDVGDFELADRRTKLLREDSCHRGFPPSSWRRVVLQKAVEQFIDGLDQFQLFDLAGRIVTAMNGCQMPTGGRPRVCQSDMGKPAQRYAPASAIAPAAIKQAPGLDAAGR